MEKKDRSILFIVVTATIMMANFSIDNYLPSVPFIAKDFGVDVSTIQVSVGIYTAGTMLAAFLVGLFTIKFNRRFLYFSSVSLAIIGSLMCAAAQESIMLIVGRFILGMAIGGMISIGLTIFTDVFKRKTLAKIISMVVLCIAVVPAISPLLGGFIEEHLGWRMNFILPCIVYVIIIAVAYFMLSETTVYRNKDAQFLELLDKFFQPIKSIPFISCTFAYSIAFGAELTYLVMGPHIFQVFLKLSPVEYGSLAMFVTAALFFSSMFNKFLLKYKSFRFILGLGNILLFVAVVLLFAFYYMGYFNVFVIVFPAVVFLFGAYLIIVNAMPIAISKTDNTAGTASALFNFLQRIIASVMSIGAAYLPCESQVSLGVVFLVVAILLIPVLFLIFNSHTNISIRK